MTDKTVQTSKYLSLLLRHKPETIGLKLDENGWANIQDLLAPKTWLTMELVLEAVRTNNKQRFAISEDGLRIRAQQGHTVEGLDLQLEEKEPPEFLYHGTYQGAVETIRHQGLSKMKRHHVHLSSDVRTAETVGSRRGVCVILRVRSGEMSRVGMKFYLSGNGVWLTDNVPPQYVTEDMKH